MTPAERVTTMAEIFDAETLRRRAGKRVKASARSIVETRFLGARWSINVYTFDRLYWLARAEHTDPKDGRGSILFSRRAEIVRSPLSGGTCKHIRDVFGASSRDRAAL